MLPVSWTTPFPIVCPLKKRTHEKQANIESIKARTNNEENHCNKILQNSLFLVFCCHQVTIPCDCAKIPHMECVGRFLCHNADGGSGVSSPTQLDHPAHEKNSDTKVCFKFRDNSRCNRKKIAKCWAKIEKSLNSNGTFHLELVPYNFPLGIAHKIPIFSFQLWRVLGGSVWL